MVYLLCLSRRLASHAKHYIGSTANVRARLQRHRSGRGSAMLAACNRRGISYTVARTWRGDRKTERRLKTNYKSHDLCPRCSGRAAYQRGKV